ncbi:MAG TPA: folylpolyglutamate synthase/dihydrofolate synthase family protein [Bacteroidales bacterium]|nr:folylpolyglutamate synthase/dihydrofolate synthase family protein [Bacteroidales bacterium]
MTFAEAEKYIMEQLPMYERQGNAGYQGGLEKTLLLLEKFNNPHLQFPSIHIAGTNGKGSVSSMIASILQEAGYNVGLYTSPHLKTIRERIKINAQMIPAHWITNFTKKNLYLIEQIKPSFFEINTVMAFCYFAESDVDIAVIETGLGGRLDATNVIRPLVSIITSISFDHMKLLGNTLQQIATEKAGIIKPNVPCIIGEKNLETIPVFEQFAQKNNAPITFANDKFITQKFYQSLIPPKIQVELNDENKKIYKLTSPLVGKVQIENMKTVLCTIEILKSYKYKINYNHIRNGFSRVIENTGLFGRWSYIPNNVPIIMDIGHNVGAVNNLVEMLNNIEKERLHIVWGMMADKDVEGILKLLPSDAEYYFCSPHVPRALDSRILLEKAKKIHLNGKSYKSVRRALYEAKRCANRKDLIFVGGSAFVVAEAM